jgi:phosphoribosylanthranilate isomerase
VTVKIKVCGLTDSSAVAAAVQSGVDAVGFVFYEKSPRNLNIGQAVELAQRVPDTVLKVAVMLHPDADTCAAILERLSPDILQTNESDFDYLKVPDNIGRWPVIRENAVDGHGPFPDRFVYEGRSSGQGEIVDWNRAARYSAKGDMILAGGLDAANVAEAIRVVRPWCVDVSSGVESSPGKKDPQAIEKFVAAARAAG